MPTTDPGEERGALGFVDATRWAFSFLGDRGFSVVSAEPTFVRYESLSAFVNVYHGRASYELGVEVGRWLAHNSEWIEQKFPVSDVIELTGNETQAGLRPLAATEPDAVRMFVSLLADWTRNYAERALSGDDAFFTDLSVLAARRSDELQDNWRAERLRGEADDVWRRKDYAAVIDAYSALAELPSIHLTQLELGRLRYAHKQRA